MSAENVDRRQDRAAGKRPSLLCRLRDSRRGGVSTMLGAATPVMIGFMGLAIDTTYWESAKISMQGATDQATIAAGRAYRSDQNVTTEAVAVLAAHGLSNGLDNVVVTVAQPPTTGLYAGRTDAIHVTVSQPQPTIFSSVLGVTPPTLTTHSVAAPSTSGGGACVIALATSGVGISLNGSNTIDISKCNVYNNSVNADGTTLVGGGTITTLNAHLVGDWAGSGMFNVSRVLERGASPVADPYGTRNIPPVPPGRCDATNASHNSSASYAAKTDGIFVFCGGLKLTGSGNTLTLAPGLYMFDRNEFSINGAWTINGSNVSLLFTSSTVANHATLKVQANQVVNLVAPTAGPAKGIALWMHRNAPATSDINFGGSSTLNITGAIYAANAAVTVSGSNGSSACTQVVARSIVFNGNNMLKHDCVGVGISDPPGSLPALVLVQ